MTKSRVAIVTGITGQDGSYLAELLLGKGYVVHGLIRRSSNVNTKRIDHLYLAPQEASSRLHLHYGDIADDSRMIDLLATIDPDEIYHLAAQSHVRVSFDEPMQTANTTGLGTLRILEAMRILGSKARFYQASSSEMFGGAAPPQSENTPFYPKSPYGASKVFGYWMVRNYRESYGLHASNGILFNHESPRRGITFVTRKISLAAANIKLGHQKELFLGNLESRRDWGYAPEYVEGMWKILQHSEPDDFVLATGTSYSVADFLRHAFEAVDLDWQDYVKLDERYLRPAEVDSLIGDFSKAQGLLGWSPHVLVPDLATMMVKSDLDALQRNS